MSSAAESVILELDAEGIDLRRRLPPGWPAALAVEDILPIDGFEAIIERLGGWTSERVRAREGAAYTAAVGRVGGVWSS
tara:strand:- start:46 stop:282 length:237 start_codon:yes stop_codon:yes gene_type:complete